MDLKERGSKPRSIGALLGLLLVLGAVPGVQAEPPAGFPSRKPDSADLWGPFLGRAAHRAIGHQYEIEHSGQKVFINNVNLSTIMKKGELGDPERLPDFVRLICPDITNVNDRVLFEIKPDTWAGRRQAGAQVGYYLAVLNAAVEPDKKLSGGTGFEGSLFLDFEKGGALWQLSWRTPEPGVTLYRWSYRRKNPSASWKERAAQKQGEIPLEEIEQRGELAEQALRAAYGEGDWPDAFEGKVYLPVECR